MYFIRVSDRVTEWKSEYKGGGWTRTIQHNIGSIIGSDPIYLVDARPRKASNCFMRQVSQSYPVPYLKSNIQKTLRRGRIHECLSTAQHLLRQETMEALRRLPIIFLEDAQWHPESFSLVIWLMAAHAKGYRLTTLDEHLVLEALATALSATNRYDLHADVDTLVTAEGYSIALRADFGGMKGDVAFLMRLAKRAPLLKRMETWSALPSFPTFSIDQMIPEAIDFHCCGSLIPWCIEKTHMEADTLQSVIWWHWSSPNIRPMEDEESSYREEVERRHTLAQFMRIHSLLTNYAETKIKWFGFQVKRVMIQTTLSMTTQSVSYCK